MVETPEEEFDPGSAGDPKTGLPIKPY